MSLENQVYIYSVDTGAFYTKRERKITRLIWNYKSDQKRMERKIKKIDKDLVDKCGLTKKDVEQTYEKNFDPTFEGRCTLLPEQLQEKIDLRTHYNSCKDAKKTYINQAKEKLSEELLKHANHSSNKATRHIRTLHPRQAKIENKIAVFESSLSRTFGISKNEFTENIIVVRIYYYEILKDLINNGFYFNGKRYIYFTSSAGQIRTKKAVFMEESLWEQYKLTFMCGLTLEKINALGGINVNKYLAYLALTSSATDYWEDFDIDKCIVVDDFETCVIDDVDFIDDIDYSVRRMTMPVPIPHTDGAGMQIIKPKKNFMVRLPWIKGLLGYFDYRKFIAEHNGSHIIRDIYGKEYDIFKDDIQIIFTKSQFKLWKFYSSWDEYKTYFKHYKCQAGICKMEETKIPDAKINYQMIQTLTDITDEELTKFAQPSINAIKDVATSVQSMLKIFGLPSYSKNKTYLQQSLEIYPELLRDSYCKQTIKSLKTSMIKNARAGHLDVKGKFTFVLPDFYAFCEWLFLGIEEPNGLLAKNEVYCKLYPTAKKLDCLRSPHLYKEHAIRNNVVDKDRSEWFCTNGIYTSTYDLISKILQFDDR